MHASRFAVVLIALQASCRSDPDGRNTSAAAPAPIDPAPVVDARGVDSGAASSCLSAGEVRAQLEAAEKIAKIGEREGATTEKVSAVCTKHVYRRNGRRIVIWKTASGVLKLAVGTERDVTPACFARAVELGNTIVPYGRALLAAAARRYGDTWEDADIGGASWIVCDASEQPTIASVITLLHESNHTLTDGGCLNEPASGTSLCFALDDRGLPRRSIARLERVPGLDQVDSQIMAQIQDLYLGALDQGPLGLFDELLAYCINTDALTARVEPPVVKTPTGSIRTVNHLPLFMALTVRYLIALRTTDPALYERTFGEATANRRSLDTLLERADQAYRGWVDALAAAKFVVPKYERTLYAQYTAERRRWLGGHSR